MKTYLTIALIAFAAASAHAADNKQMQIESWSFGCSNPAMASQQSGSGAVRASYDLKTAKGARMAPGGEPTVGAASVCLNGLPPGQPILRESPSKGAIGRKHELTGHVTLMK
jgi:hypothetical protein